MTRAHCAVVASEVEAHLAVAGEHILRLHRPAAAGRLLVDHRLRLHNLALSQSEHQRPVPRHAHRVGPAELHPDQIRVRSGGNDKIVFELPAGAVVDYVDTRIGLPVTHPAKVRHVCLPPVRPVSYEVVRAGRLRIQCFHHRRPVAACQVDAQGGRLRAIHERKDHAGFLQQQRVSRAAGEIHDLGSGKSPVRLEPGRQTLQRSKRRRSRPACRKRPENDESAQ